MLGRFSFSAEPAQWAEFVRLGLVFFMLMGWIHLNEAQKLSLMAFVSFGLTYIVVRPNVTSQNTLKQAGLSQAIVEQRAEDKTIKPFVDQQKP